MTGEHRRPYRPYRDPKWNTLAAGCVAGVILTGILLAALYIILSII